MLKIHPDNFGAMPSASGHHDASVHGFYDSDSDYLLKAHSRIVTANPTHSALIKFFTPEILGFKIMPVHPASLFLATIYIFVLISMSKSELSKKDVYKD